MSASGSDVSLWIVAFALCLQGWSIISDRTRIRKNVEARGGRVIAIKGSLWAPGPFYEHGYNVIYLASDGHQIVARCHTSWRSGVVSWAADSPPGI